MKTLWQAGRAEQVDTSDTVFVLELIDLSVKSVGGAGEAVLADINNK